MISYFHKKYIKIEEDLGRIQDKTRNGANDVQVKKQIN